MEEEGGDALRREPKELCRRWKVCNPCKMPSAKRCGGRATIYHITLPRQGDRPSTTSNVHYRLGILLGQRCL